MITAALTNAGIVALVTMFMGVVPLIVGMAYAVRPSEHHLAMMRPLSLATIFGAITGTSLGVLDILRLQGLTDAPAFTSVVAIGLSEALVPVFFGFGCLTGAWLCVAFGLWRRP
jgi:hypothetical protein